MLNWESIHKYNLNNEIYLIIFLQWYTNVLKNNDITRIFAPAKKRRNIAYYMQYFDMTCQWIVVFLQSSAVFRRFFVIEYVWDRLDEYCNYTIKEWVKMTYALNMMNYLHVKLLLDSITLSSFSIVLVCWTNL